MIVGVGIDVVEIARFEQALSRTTGLAARLFTGCMKASLASGACWRTSSISGIEATSKPRTPLAASVSITHGDGFALTA